MSPVIRFLSTRIWLGGVACLLTMGLSTSHVWSQSQFQFGRAANEPFSGRFRVVNKVLSPASELSSASKERLGAGGTAKVLDLNKTNTLNKRRIQSVNLKPVLDRAWQDGRKPLSEGLQKFINERDIGAGGIRPSFTVINFDEQGDLFVGTDARGLTLRYVLKNNTLSTRFRVPGPTPSSWDPAFEVKFDLELLIDLDPTSATLKVGAPRVKLNVGRPEGKNLTGDLAMGANSLVKFLLGQDMIGTLLKKVNGKEMNITSGINLELARLTPALRSVTKDVFISTSFDKVRNEVVFTLQKDTPPIVR